MPGQVQASAQSFESFCKSLCTADPPPTWSLTTFYQLAGYMINLGNYAIYSTADTCRQHSVIMQCSSATPNSSREQLYSNVDHKAECFDMPAGEAYSHSTDAFRIRCAVAEHETELVAHTDVACIIQHVATKATILHLGMCCLQYPTTAGPQRLV